MNNIGIPVYEKADIHEWIKECISLKIRSEYKQHKYRLVSTSVSKEQKEKALRTGVILVDQEFINNAIEKYGKYNKRLIIKGKECRFR